MTTGRRAIVVLLLVLAPAAKVNAQGALASARERYRDARYELALEALAGIDTGSDAIVEADRIRALCLLALGRGEEADRAIARVVLARPSDPLPDASPRIRSAFRAVRDQVLPAWADEQYEAGKSAFEARDFAGALARFESALPVLEALALDGRRDMEARRILATDFLALSRRLMPPPLVEVPPLPARAPDLASPVPMARGVAVTATTPPIVLRQDLPPWPHVLGTSYATFRGAIDVVISEEGHVVDATMVASVHPRYDPELLRASRGWRYEPARRNGRAVPAVKRVDVELGGR